MTEDTPVPQPLNMGPEASSTAAPRPSNGLAVAALVVGIVGLIAPLLGVVALILGIVAATRSSARKGVAVAAIVCGAVGFAGWVVVGFLIYRESTQRMACLKNMQSTLAMLTMYSTQNSGWLPPDLPTATNFIQRRAGAAARFGPAVIQCPNSKPDEARVYIFLFAATRLSKIKPYCVLLYEPLGNHHGGICAGFADGHVEWVPEPKASAYIKALESGRNPPWKQTP